MIDRTTAQALPRRAEGPISVAGWIHRRRRLANVTFLVLRDRTGLAQIVVTDAAVRSLVDELGEESVIRIDGRLTRNLQAPQGVEITEPTITVLSRVEHPPPIELWRPRLSTSLPTLLDHAPLSWRHPARQAVWRVAAASVRGFRDALDELEFVEVQTPKIVASATESGANVFEIDYFGERAFLAQSPQFYKQTMVGVFERVYEVGPVFRAEPHDTARHLAEYVSLDVELGYIESHRDVLAVLTAALRGMVAAVRGLGGDVLTRAGVRLPTVPEQVPVVHFQDAIRIVGADENEPDLDPEHERQLCAWGIREYGTEFLAVEGYPAIKRPFYTHPQPDDPRWTNSFDLLFRGLELVTGGQRLHRYDDYLRALEQRAEPRDSHATYLDVFRYGMPPHGGFAIGLERWTARLLEVDNIRRTTLFPRDLHRLSP